MVSLTCNDCFNQDSKFSCRDGPILLLHRSLLRKYSGGGQIVTCEDINISLNLITLLIEIRSVLILAQL